MHRLNRINPGIFGILAFIFYVGAVIIGGMLIPGYNHFNQAISELDPLIGRDYKIYLNLLFGSYNLMVVLFGSGVFISSIGGGKRALSATGICLFLAGLFGTLMYFFPTDVVGTSVTTRGIIHGVLAGLLAPLSITVTFLGLFAFEKSWMKLYSLATSIVILAAGASTVYFATHGIRPGFGLLERITIGSFIFWLLLCGIYFFKKPGVE